MDGGVKLMYFGPKPGDRTHAQFRERWHQHGSLAMEQSHWQWVARYLQFDVLTAGERGLSAEDLAGTSNEAFGGAGALLLAEPDHLEALIREDSNGVMEADEIPTFGRTLGSDLVRAREERLIDRGPAELTLLATVHRGEGTSREEFAARWREVGQQLAATPELARHLRSYVQNYAVDDGSPWDGLVELGFDSREEMAAFHSEPSHRDWLEPALVEFVDVAPSTRLLGAERVFYEKADSGTGLREGTRS